MKEEEVDIFGVFEELKQMADGFGAAKADFKFNDGEWEYTIMVKRLRKKKS